MPRYTCPSYTDMYRDVLEAIQQRGGRARVDDIVPVVCRNLNISQMSASEMHYQGNVPTNETELRYRLRWCMTHLRSIGALSQTRDRQPYVLTQEGLRILADANETNQVLDNRRIQMRRKVSQARTASAFSQTVPSTTGSSFELPPVPQVLQPYVDLLKASHQLVLTGAPGTGKTYLAQEIASAMTGESVGSLQSSHIGFCQFHPMMDYVDFVEGLRPIRGAHNTVGFERRDGLFMDFCRRAIQANDPSRDYVFIIDEINRGDISKIFGELFYAIDSGYRGSVGAIKTQYSNLDVGIEFAGGFYVPENVYIIGTMNDIDRGVESMDFAIRRRFVWQEVKPDERFTSMMSQFVGQAWVTTAQTVMRTINGQIEQEALLGAAYCIGPAYFAKLGALNGDFSRLWQLSLKPLLQEYLRGVPGASSVLDQLKRIYDDAWQSISPQGAVQVPVSQVQLQQAVAQ